MEKREKKRKKNSPITNQANVTDTHHAIKKMIQ